MSTFDQRHIRRAFSRSAAGYDAAAALQHEVEKRLLESLDYFALRQGQDAADPKVVLDVGCGPAHAAAAMRKIVWMATSLKKRPSPPSTRVLP